VVGEWTRGQICREFWTASDEHRRLLLVPNGGVPIRHARQCVDSLSGAVIHLRTWLRESNDLFCFSVDFAMITRI